MALNLNSVQIVGRLVSDPEIKALPSGQSVANLSIATNHVYTKDGDKKESVEYHSIIVFGKQAENSAKFLKKAQYVQVTGRLQTRKWEKDGVTHYKTEIIADSVQFGDMPQPPKAGNTNVDYPVPDETNDPSMVPF